MGGQDRTLLFGISGFLQYIRDQIQGDPFDFMDNAIQKDSQDKEGTQVLVLFDNIPVMVYAGLNCYLDSKDEANVPFDKVKKWCRALNQETIIEIYKESYSALLTNVKTEAPPETANGQEKVNA